MLFKSHKVFHLVKTQHQYIVNNTQLRLRVSVLLKHIQANIYYMKVGDRGSSVVKVLCYKSDGRWFDPSWCHWT